MQIGQNTVIKTTKQKAAASAVYSMKMKKIIVILWCYCSYFSDLTFCHKHLSICHDDEIKLILNSCVCLTSLMS